MEIHVMSGRYGIELDKPVISTNLKSLQSQMRNWYYKTLEDYDESCIDMEMSFINKNNACIAYRSDWLEKVITTQEIEINSI
jgi:hypothetical protein